MASHDKKQEEHNAVENLNENLTKAGLRMQEHKKVILWVVLAIVAIGAFVVSYLFIYKNPRTNKSWEEYAKVQMQAMGNDSVAIAGFKKVADKYNGADGGAAAALEAGMAMYQKGDYKGALVYLEKADVTEPVLEASVTKLIGDCYVNLKQYDKALGMFDKAISQANGNPQLVPVIMMKKANIYEKQKNYKLALETYEGIKKDYPEFNYGMGMDAYINRTKARLGQN